MIGTTFITPNSKKNYKVIEKHKIFQDVWRCYPVNQEPPYKQNLIDCFSTDFIKDALKQELDDTLYLHR